MASQDPALIRTALTPAVYLVLIEDEGLLMTRRINTGNGDGQYSLVAGHVEAGEKLTDAIIREAYEEAGITLTAPDLSLVHTLHRPKDERIDFFFTAQAWQGEIQINEPDKCEDLAWFPLAALPDAMLPYIGEVIGHIQNGVPFSERE